MTTVHPAEDVLVTSRIPYDARPGVGDIWPNGARVAVLVYTAPEEWVWSEHEPFPSHGAFAYKGDRPSLSTRSSVEYGFQVGLRRLRDIYARFDMKVTLWTNGRTVEKHGELMAEMAAAGHELGAHGYSEGRPMAMLDTAAQRESIERTTTLIRDLTGERPTGWIGPGGDATAETLDLLSEAGYTYNADLADDELPYFLHTATGRLVVVPYRKVGNINDLPLFLRNVQSVSSGVRHLTEAFDAYRRAAETHPLLFNYGNHPHISGRPDNGEVLTRFLEHVHGCDDVWVTSYAGLVDWWEERWGGRVPAGGGDLLT